MTSMFAFMMPGPMEMVVIAMIALLLFGGRLPSMARNVGASVFELRKGLSEAFDDVEEPKESETS